MRSKFMRLSRIFPEIRRAARQRERFDAAAANIERLLSEDKTRTARRVTRALVIKVLGSFAEDSRRSYLCEVRERWEWLIDLDAIVEEYRYRQEYRSQTRNRGW